MNFFGLTPSEHSSGGKRVQGGITLRLQNVPWDQALDIVMRTKGLDMRRDGNVMFVAPAAEIAAREKELLTARQQVQQLAALRTEYLQINYAKAQDLAARRAAQRPAVGARGDGLAARGAGKRHAPMVEANPARLPAFDPLEVRLPLPGHRGTFCFRMDDLDQLTGRHPVQGVECAVGIAALEDLQAPR